MAWLTARLYNVQVAMQMGAPVRKKDSVATSPYGTPKGARSPLSRCLFTCLHFTVSLHHSICHDPRIMPPGVASPRAALKPKVQVPPCLPCCRCRQRSSTIEHKSHRYTADPCKQGRRLHSTSNMQLL